MIPKTIHYCWFGGNPLPPIAVKCIKSWQKYCENFKIIEWNEHNFDINMTVYSQEALKAKKWAFIADVACFYVLYTHGGIYLDVDVEIIKPIDKFLQADMFMGFESDNEINATAVFGAKKNLPLVKKMLDIYKEMKFINPDGTFNNIPSPKYTSRIMGEEGFELNNTRQFVRNIEVYPCEYFSPKDWQSGEINVTSNTHTIHHFLASWWSEEERQQREAEKQKFNDLISFLKQ